VSNNLARQGYTNAINALGVAQFSLGLMLDDPTFTFRGPGHTAAAPVTPFIEGNTLRWLNFAWSNYNIYVFDKEDETNPANAIATGSVPSPGQDMTGQSGEHSIRMAFDLSTLKLEKETDYFVRLQAVPYKEEPVTPFPSMIWGAPSRLSDAIEYEYAEYVFNDVFPNAWYYESVMYAYDNDLMEGFPDGSFKPNDSLTRAQVVTILYRMAGSPSVTGMDNPFSDVSAGQWWTNQIIWAADDGIVIGYPDGTFGGNNAVTKSELAVIIYRWQLAEDWIPEDIIEHEWPDIDEVRDWAIEAVETLTAQGLFRDIPDADFAPQSPASRAVVASVLFRLLIAFDSGV